MTKPDCLGRENSRVLTKKWPSYFIKAYLLYDIIKMLYYYNSF